MQRRQLKSKEDFWIFVDDWQQNTNSFVLRKKLFPNYHLDPNKGSKGDPKEGYPRRLLKSMLRRLF